MRLLAKNTTAIARSSDLVWQVASFDDGHAFTWKAKLMAFQWLLWPRDY
jgi:hypothetical protein